MPNQSGPTSTTGKAASSRNAMRHGLTNLHPVVTEADRPEYEALREHLRPSASSRTSPSSVSSTPPGTCSAA
ncbi:MAG: hypothetical protein JNN08_25680 [Bryobacterales bacterium]|nr:hypothetical protein [Bryobacterales bacterium]